MTEIDHDAAIQQAANFDWHQVALNGGPPCFHFSEEGFCGRAKRWEGHGKIHAFIGLEYIVSLAERAKRLENLVRSGQPLADVNSPEGLQWMLDARAALASRHNADTEIQCSE